MHTPIKAAVLAATLLAAGSAAAGATVTFKQPEQFADVPRTSWEREQLMKDIGAHVGRLAQALPAGQELSIDVLDLDLAGQTWPNRWGHTEDIRILNGRADWPSITLRYTLSEGGKVLMAGDERLSNMSYLQRGNRYGSGDALRYEKQMLDDWFKEKISPRQVSAR
jgi:hypothetical protein